MLYTRINNEANKHTPTQSTLYNMHKSLTFSFFIPNTDRQEGTQFIRLLLIVSSTQEPQKGDFSRLPLLG
jgi:hypothetical protein